LSARKRPDREQTGENHADRDPSGRCWLAHVFLPEGHTDEGIIGWSEFNESFGSTGLSDVIRGLSPVLIGRDPRMFEQVTQHLHVLTRQSRGGLNQQALAAIENALLDVTGKAYGVPVYALFGGPIRDRIPVYWSHFGTYRVRSAALMGVPPLAIMTTSRGMPRR
jgi:galactonate dehydratase